MFVFRQFRKLPEANSDVCRAESVLTKEKSSCQNIPHCYEQLSRLPEGFGLQNTDKIVAICPPSLVDKKMSGEWGESAEV